MESQSKFAIAAVVLIMMAGAAVFGFMSIAFNDDKYTAPHDYEVVSGTCDGFQASGTGHSKYLNESQREYLYQFDTKVELQGGQTREFTFSVICDSDHVPVDIYSRGASETVDGKDCVWWGYSVGSERYDFALDGDMVVHRYVVSDVSGAWSFTSELKGRGWTCGQGRRCA